MRITRMQVNHVTNPMGFDLGGRPTFSWVVEDARGTRATASRVVVTCWGETLADTGWADLDAHACTLDVLLTPHERYEWTVSVRTDAGEEATSEPAWFETAKPREPWIAQWLTCDYDEPRHPVFFKELALRGEVAMARLHVCGLGVYEARISGRRVSEERLAPGTHAYDQWLQYQTYDVTDLVHDGARLEIALGHGWYSGRFGFVLSDKGFYGDDWRLIAEMHLTYTNGTEQIIGTDGSWQVTRSNVTFSNIYDGEHRDDTLPPVAPVPATLLPAGQAAEATARLHGRLSLPVVPHETFVPTVLRTPAGECVLDLGQNIAGSFRMRVHEPAGARVHLQFGELLQDGNFYRDNLRTAKAEYWYTSDGAEHVLEPSFTFYGYRYVRVEVDGVAPEAFDPEDFTGYALYSDFDAERGQIVTGNAKVNQLVSNARWGMKGNFLDTATDCPQRDERMGWTGDANVFSGTALRLAAPYAFYRKYLYDMALEQAARGGQVPATVPAFGSQFGNGTAVWGDATCRIPWNMYEVDGDPAILAEHFDAMRGWVDWIEGVDAGDAHVWGKVFQFGDWLALDGPVPGGVMGGTDTGLIAYLSWWDSTMTVAAAAHVLGRAEDEAHYRALADRIHEWIEAEYYTATGRCAVNTQTAYVLSLWYGFGNRAWSTAQLRRLLQENGGKLKTGFTGTPLLCPVLSQNGLDREAYDLLLNEDYPGWLFAVNLGATTIWERWDSLDADGHITGIGMNSMNHYSYGSIVEWLMSYAAGLNLALPGFARATVAPHVDWRLHSASAQMATASGTYATSWECVDETHLRMTVTVPFGGAAEVTLPFATEAAYEELGGHTLAAGSYEVTYETTKPLRRVPCVDWTVAQLLDDPAIANAARPFVDGFDFCMNTADPTCTLRELQAKGLGQNVKMTAEQLEACDAALRALAD
jgi:alpha-L-rhamnosidase